MTPADIQLLFAAAGPSFAGGYNGGAGLASPLTLASIETAQRTAELRQVLLAVQQYWLAGSPDMDLAAEILGDASRDASWRKAIGESGLLDFFLSILAVIGLRQSLKIHTLRLIGNSCADEDENRVRVVSGNHIGRIVSLLGDDTTLAFVIPVLYNICVDFKPAQLQACQAHLSRTLVDIISGPRLYQCRAFLNIICKIFGLLVTQEAEIPLADPATPHYLLQLAANPEMSLDGEEFCILASVALAYLAYEPFQEELIRRSGVQALLSAFSDSFTKYDIGEMDPDDVEEFKSLGNRFMHVIADVVALPSFLPQYPLNSHAVQTLRVWVANSFNITSLQTAGCIALGNLARSDQSSIYFVHDVKIHIPLIKLLSNPYAALQLPSETTPDGIPPSSQLIYAVLSFLKNLAIPAANKPMLGTLLDPPASILPRLWNSTDAQPQVQFAAVSLARLLLLNCPANVRKICTPLSTDASSPAHDRSNLHVLISLFKRTDAENTKTEAARAVVAVCRVLHTSPDADSILPEDWEPTEDASIYSGSTHTNTNSAFSSSEPSPNTMNSTGPVSDMDETITAPPSIVTPAPGASYQLRRARFCNAHMDMSDCFGYLMTQERFPVLRSEIWFVSAILSRSTDGAHLVLRALQPFEACRMLVEAVTGRDLVEGHRLPGGESLLSDDELLSMANATGAVAPSALAVGNASGADVQAPFGLPHESASAVEPTATAGASGGVEGLGLEPQQADPAQAASMARADRENGLVLISEIMKNYSHFQPPFRRGVFEQILQSGGALVMYASTEAEQSAK